MKQAVVRAEQIGTGTKADPFRAALDDYILEVPGRTGFWEWKNPFTRSSLAFVRGKDVDVDAALADIRITPLSPVFTNNRSLIKWTRQPSRAAPSIVKNIFEQDRVPFDWVSDGIKWSQFLTFVSLWHSSMHYLSRVDRRSFKALNKTLDEPLTQRELLNVRVWTALADHGFNTPRRLAQDIARQAHWHLLSLGPFTAWNTRRRVRSSQPIVKRDYRN